MKKNEIKEKKYLVKKNTKSKTINLEEFEKLSVEEQAKYFEDIFKKIYNGIEVESLRKYSLRCIKLTCDPKDNKVHLPYGVLVEKKKDKVIIEVKDNKPLLLILILGLLLLFALLGASYISINNFIIKDLNKDIDGDGIPDINLDLNEDKIPEINIDTNRNDVPDVNVDFKGNRKPIFNIDTDGDMVPDFNLLNQDTNNDGVCDLNCDLNDDGWPDINYDLDGDGNVDLEEDINEDMLPDLNFDMNNDGVCDLHCDTNNDKICDKYCIPLEEVENIDPTTNGSSSVVGNDKVNIKADELVLEYEDGDTIYITGLYPDDQPGYQNNNPKKTFKVINKSGLYVMYNLRWVVEENDYESDNFKYKITSTLNGANFDFKTAPKSTSLLASNIIIPPYTTQDYTVEFKLQGVGGNQNYDQGKTFAGYIEIYLDNR